mmetsp:Transcript_64870/g.154894  ORF Transcript_64870/g.154894 Transcript_64870/m.154894 type:complete len:199 (+) Transcript_64870:96-692(+)
MFNWLWGPEARQEPHFSLGPTAGRPPSVPQTGPRYDMAEPRGYPTVERQQAATKKTVCGVPTSSQPPKEPHHHELVPPKPVGPTARLQGPLHRGIAPIEARFEEAQREAVRRISDQNSNEERALIYGYYMQAKYGDCTETQPSGSAERMQWKEWLRHHGMSKESAMERYTYAVECVTNFTITPYGQLEDPHPAPAQRR